MKSKTISVTIACGHQEVYDFASNLKNLPKWAGAFCLSIEKKSGKFIAQTPQGPVTIRMVERNTLGVMDHYVVTAEGSEVFVPMRVVANELGSEVLFTLFRRSGMTDAQYEQDIKFVERDLTGLKSALEN